MGKSARVYPQGAGGNCRGSSWEPLLFLSIPRARGWRSNILMVVSAAINSKTSKVPERYLAKCQ